MVTQVSHIFLFFAGLVPFLFFASNGVRAYAQQTSQEKHADTGDLHHVRTLQQTFSNRKHVSSPLWPANKTQKGNDQYDRKFLQMMRAMNADSSARRTLQLTDSLETGETLCQYNASTVVLEIHTTDSTLIVKVAGFDVSKILIDRYSHFISADTQSSSDTCTIEIRGPWTSPSVSQMVPAFGDTTRRLLAMQIPFLILEGFVERETPRIKDSVAIPTVTAQMLMKYYTDFPVIREAVLFAPREISEEKLIFHFRIIASGNGGLVTEDLRVNGEIVVDRSSRTIQHLWLKSETMLSPVGKAIPLEGYGEVSATFTGN